MYYELADQLVTLCVVKRKHRRFTTV